ncbi:hypothetical protein CHARACLAT_013724 [Characodon lateralis]|uniref:Uncharacterized protein n=1 Tax=Characodon lateralis TaxID=208331 RepID=A0ABU7F3T4_9TELE|nr:hypothetical protein [Characodon lateralis]
MTVSESVSTCLVLSAGLGICWTSSLKWSNIFSTQWDESERPESAVPMPPPQAPATGLPPNQIGTGLLALSVDLLGTDRRFGTPGDPE